MTANKQIIDFSILAKEELGKDIYLLKLHPQQGVQLPEMQAGQFVQVLPPGGLTLLRRPISICNYLPQKQELWLLVAAIGRGTRAITSQKVGDTLNLILPLGNSFNTAHVTRPLLIGGGVGIAPMLSLCQKFFDLGIRPTVLLGGRSEEFVVLREHFSPICELYVTTDDGTLGHKGRVTDHPIMENGDFDQIYCCGPHPMMKAVAQIAENKKIACELSLENTMACGIGACLCCVQDTVSEGNVCVCTEGPVFPSQEIKW